MAGRNYCIILATHNPSDERLGAISRSIDHFIRKERVNLVIIASGDKKSLQAVSNMIKPYVGFTSSGMLSYRFTSNYGIPHSWNLGIELAIDNGAEIMTL